MAAAVFIFTNILHAVVTQEKIAWPGIYEKYVIGLKKLSIKMSSNVIINHAMALITHFLPFWKIQGFFVFNG